MAALTWRDVTAPNFSGVAVSQQVAGNLMNTGFQSGIDALAGFSKSQDEAANGEFLSRIAGYGTADSLRAALGDGSVFEGLDRSAITAETFDRADAHAKSLLGDVQTGVQTEGNRIQNAGQLILNQGYGYNNQHQSLVNDHLSWTNTVTQDREAARPGASTVIAESTALADDGTDAGRQAAEARIMAGQAELAAYGYTPDQVAAALTAARTGVKSGIDTNNAVIAHEVETQKIADTDQAKVLVDSVLAIAATPTEGQKLLTEANAPPEVIVLAQELFATQAPALYGQAPDPNKVIRDQLLAGASGGPGSAAQAAAATANQALVDVDAAQSGQAQTIQNTITAGAMFSGDRLLSELEDRPLKGKSDADIATDVKTRMGDFNLNGVDGGVPLREITDVITQIRRKYPGLDSDLAGAFMLDAIQQNMFGTRWVVGDVDINMPEFDRLIRTYYNPDAATQAEALQPAVNQFEGAQSRETTAQALPAAIAAVEEARVAYFTAVEKQKTKPGVDVQGPRLTYEALQGQLARLIAQADANPFTRGNTPLPK